jgi:hypothetical protein
VIFDSEAMLDLRRKYAALDNRHVPEVVFLDRSDRLAAEREILEYLLSVAPIAKQKDWLGRLVNEDNGQFWGAWFEIMLWEWLQAIGPVTPEPEIVGDKPDFVLTVGDQQIAIEARAYLFTSGSERALSRGKRPGLIWIQPIATGIKAALREKAVQHKSLRKANHAYVLAIMLESNLMTPEEVATAWFGTGPVVIEGRRVKAITTNQTGLHYLGAEVRHTSVSGTLVFQVLWDKHQKRRKLEAYYIQNPYAKVKVNPTIFPVQAKYVAVQEDTAGNTMGWRTR